MAFIYGYGGTGKTFLWTTIISALRSEGKIVLAVAASGIASLLLLAGRTAHSRFKIPLNLTDQSTCYIKKNTHLAQLLTETTLIIWDEAPMNDRRCFEPLDRTLRDLLNRPHQPFGGQSILLGGDFRQTLPVIPKASKNVILSSSLPRSYLWRHFKVYKLTENMCFQSTNLDANHRAKIATFSSWLLDVGDGKLGTPDVDNPQNTRNIEIPLDYVIPYSDNALQELIQFIYDDATLQNPTTEILHNKAIVCPKNETAQEINNMVLACSPGYSKIYLSTDTMIPNLGSHGDIEMLYPTEYLNLLHFSELPPHQLELKVNTPVMLIRNINQTAGLCNGTRLIITQLLPRVIEAHIVTGTAIGHRVYIPRISLTHTDNELPFTFKRKQFPIKLCYAMTINKSQGQSLNKIGVYLPEPVFDHGQLYVALSRATSPDSLKILTTPMKDMPSNVTKNIVYSDFLHQIDINQS
ncbi:ATP-dependent DNA helicase pif1-like [Helianthus annuus]|uniref:ATP-dependent DNA helicase pif1-like n=1 Tax=Helianthus annuus TaxID=4232 RepID=UPI0016530E31|nr:ATP-dependent DNA helicase pif1-like [Helianthus annuus]